MALGLVFFASHTWGQNEDDVFRYSYQESLGSARTMGMGGAFGALGADLSCLTGNPAGLGMYRRGDVGLTTGFASQKTKISVAGQFGNASKISGSTTNIGIALSYPSVNPDWPVSTLAVTHTRRANYNQSIEIEDIPFENSLVSTFLGQAQGYSPSDLNATFPFTAGLAWDTYLLDPTPQRQPHFLHFGHPSRGRANKQKHRQNRATLRNQHRLRIWAVGNCLCRHNPRYRQCRFQ